jgi:hypothetical protein
MANRYKHPLYQTFWHMHARADELKVPVHAAWQDIATFEADVGPRPGPGWVFARIDPSKGYTPENTQWEPRYAMLERPAIRYDVGGGRKLTMRQAAAETGIPIACLRSRIYIQGLTMQEAIRVPSQAGKRRIENERQKDPVHHRRPV